MPRIGKKAVYAAPKVTKVETTAQVVGLAMACCLVN